MQVEDVITISKNQNMKQSLLFAIDKENEEVIISTTDDRSKNIYFKERIEKSADNSLFYAVKTLTSLTQSDNLDLKTFKATQKVCEMIYRNYQQSIK